MMIGYQVNNAKRYTDMQGRENQKQRKTEKRPECDQESNTGPSDIQSGTLTI